MTYPKKSLGQHFLMHRQTAERIVEAANVTASDTVLEIGPGTGLLTTALLTKAGEVIAVETDRELIPTLQERFANEIKAGKFDLIEGDIRSFDPKSISGPYKLVANIPYYITGEIIRDFLTTEHKPASMTLLVQKEVAERIARSNKESMLSLSVKAFGTPAYKFTVPKGAFMPAPKVDSAVLSINGISNDRFKNVKESRFFDILHAGFAHKRKRLAKNLEAVSSASSISEIFDSLGLSKDVRAEDVALDEWFMLAERLSAD